MIISVNKLTKEFKVKVPSGFWRDLFYPKFKEVVAVNNISFEIKKGESVAFLGPNGAGKTTTMKMLSGLIYPTGGGLQVLDYFPFDRRRDFLMKIGLVMGNKGGLDWNLTPSQNFALLQKIYQVEEGKFNKRLKMFCEMLNVGDYLDTQVRKLSLGERMKMELLGSILHDPEVLFLDEPTIGLDIISKQKVRKFLRDLQKETDITFLLTSHDMSDIEKVCDRVIVINKGQIVYDDSLLTLTEKYSQKRYLKFIFKKSPKKKSMEKYGEVIEMGENYYVLAVDNDQMTNVMDKITSKYKLEDIDILSVPLDEIIADLFENSSPPSS